MIVLQGVSKRYVTDGVPGKWVLRDVTLDIPARASIAVVGPKGTGKTTLLRLVTGVERPTEGRVARDVRVSEPTKYLRNLQPLLSGRQNARFICRLGGYEEDMEERLARIEQLARLGAKFDQAVSGYKTQMKARLSFAISWALDCDLYVADGFNFAGDTGFGNGAVAAAELDRKAATSGLLLAAKGLRVDPSLRARCTAAICVQEGKARWFDSVDAAIASLQGAAAQPVAKASKQPAAEVADPVPEALRPAAANIKRVQNYLTVLTRGLRGQPAVVDAKQIERMLTLGKAVGMELATREQMAHQGLAPVEGAAPIVQCGATGQEPVDYFDLKAQAVSAAGGNPA